METTLQNPNLMESEIKLRKNADSDNQGSSSKEQDDAVPSSAGRYVNTLEQPLIRRPFRNTSNEDTVETVYAESNHVPLVIPKWEKPDTQRKSFHLARDPRMTSNPIMERDDDMDEDISNKAFPPDLTNNELVHTAEFLQSIIDINVENVKNEKDDLVFGESNDWKIRFWSEANTTTEEDGEENQTAGGISDDNETPRISPEQQYEVYKPPIATGPQQQRPTAGQSAYTASEVAPQQQQSIDPASGIQSGMTVQHLPPQQPAQPVAAQIPVMAQQNLIPVQANSSSNIGAPVPTLIQPSTSVLTQSNSMHPVVLLPTSAPLQQQLQPTPLYQQQQQQELQQQQQQQQRQQLYQQQQQQKLQQQQQPTTSAGGPPVGAASFTSPGDGPSDHVTMTSNRGPPLPLPRNDPYSPRRGPPLPPLTPVNHGFAVVCNGI
ncbi:hypothetical protein DAPPUDRAFT_271678 [Daphnia pulex]|uniref:Uncharacterized protein n=1 Tax=Daphnia pulex TaxID=6669 RepID=E9I2E2_DAPPU|nr:hypothetical protein DAPPUDRAFT_271678 [Daphnia pulex]|eukprot:EFX61838.1 hypothetical protein DAPPUDRAFT_271678 [Daphnia pulex]